jgi:hypothetical protein
VEADHVDFDAVLRETVEQRGDLCMKALSLEAPKQWKRIEKLCVGKREDPGGTGADNRIFVEAVLWIARTGAPWRDLPPGFGKWNSAFVRFNRWSEGGVEATAMALRAMIAISPENPRIDQAAGTRAM